MAEAKQEKYYNKDVFIEEARKAHPNVMYCYSLSFPTGAASKITIIDPDYGEFIQQCSSHLIGKTHRKRGYADRKDPRNTTLESFIRDARAVHGELYDYSEVEYKGVETPVLIGDPDYGYFWQKPIDHTYNKCNSPKRAKAFVDSIQVANRLSKDEFVRRSNAIHGNLYDYNESDYTGTNNKLWIRDPIFGYFETTPQKHIRERRGHPLRSGINWYQWDHKVPLSIICNKGRWTNKFERNRPLFKLLHNDINLERIPSIENMLKNDKIEVDNIIIRAHTVRNDYTIIHKVILNVLGIDASEIIEQDRLYMEENKKPLN